MKGAIAKRKRVVVARGVTVTDLGGAWPVAGPYVVAAVQAEGDVFPCKNGRK